MRAIVGVVVAVEHLTDQLLEELERLVRVILAVLETPITHFKGVAVVDPMQLVVLQMVMGVVVKLTLQLALP